MAKKQNLKFLACKLHTNSELNASINQQTENPKACDDNVNAPCELRQKPKHILLPGNLNINSICSKSDQIKCLLKGKIDILTITEIKLDSSFTTTQFLIDGC